MTLFAPTETECCPDWIVNCAGFACADPLYDAIVTSLFTERRDTGCGYGGWWADPQKGSRLHLIEGGTLSEQMALIEDYTIEALDWITRTALADSFDVTAEYQGGGHVLVRVSPEIERGCEFSFSGNQIASGWEFYDYQLN